MDEKNGNNTGQKQKKGSLLFIGSMWIALGLFGLIFDPSKRIIIAIQLVLGIGILVYYFWRRSKK